MNFYKNQIKSLNKNSTSHSKNEIDLILQQFLTNRKEKRGIFTLVITGFIGLAMKVYQVSYITEDTKLYI